MSLKSAKLICVNKDGGREKIIKLKNQKSFKIGYYMTNDYILENPLAKSVHCEIVSDAFNRISIVNNCKKNPISVNGFEVKIRRPLFHGNKIKIFDKEFIWEFPQNVKDKVKRSSESGTQITKIDEGKMKTPTKQYKDYQPASNSEPWLKKNKSRIKERLSVHSFAYCVGKELSDESDSENQTSKDQTMQNTKENSKNKAISESARKSIRSTLLLNDHTVRRRTFDGATPMKLADSNTSLIKFDVTLMDNKENTPKVKLGLCKESDVLVTSFSPRSIDTKTSMSFAYIKSNKNTPKSVYSTPKSMLLEANEDLNYSKDTTNQNADESNDLLEFSTPQAKHFNNSSMHLIDLITPAQPHLNSEQIKHINITPAISKNTASTLLKSALKNSKSKKLSLSIKKSKTTFAPIAEENKADIEKIKRKIPTTPYRKSVPRINITNASPNNVACNSQTTPKKQMSMFNISGVSANKSSTTPDKFITTPKKTPNKSALSLSKMEKTPKTPVNTSIIDIAVENSMITPKALKTNQEIENSKLEEIKTSKSISKQEKLIERSIDSIDETIEVSSADTDSDSIIELTDDSIHSSKSSQMTPQSIQSPSNLTSQKSFKSKTPQSLIKRVLLSSSKKTDTSTNKKRDITSTPLHIKRLSSAFSTNSKKRTSPRSIIKKNVSPKHTGRLSTLMKTPILNRKSLASSNILSKTLPRPTPKRHSCGNTRIAKASLYSTPPRTSVMNSARKSIASTSKILTANSTKKSIARTSFIFGPSKSNVETSKNLKIGNQTDTGLSTVSKINSTLPSEPKPLIEKTPKKKVEINSTDDVQAIESTELNSLLVPDDSKEKSNSNILSSPILSDSSYIILSPDTQTDLNESSLLNETFTIDEDEEEIPETQQPNKNISSENLKIEIQNNSKLFKSVNNLTNSENMNKTSKLIDENAGETSKISLLDDSKIIPKTPNFRGVKEILKTPKSSKTPKLLGVKEMFNIQRVTSTPLLYGIKETLKTPKSEPRTPIMKGIKEMVKTPKEQKTPSLKGLKEIMNTPKECKTPDFIGVKETLNNPKNPKTPNMVGVKEILKTPKSYSKTPRLKVVKELLSTPKDQIQNNLVEANTPAENQADIYDLFSTPAKCFNKDVKDLQKTPKIYSPKLRSIQKSIKTLRLASLPEDDFEGIDQVFKTPSAKMVMVSGTPPKSANIKKALTPNENILKPAEFNLQDDIEKIDDSIFQTPSSKLVNNSIDMVALTPEEKFDKLIGKSPIKKCYSAKTSSSKPSTIPVDNSIMNEETTSDIQEWVDNIELPNNSIDILQTSDEVNLDIINEEISKENDKTDYKSDSENNISGIGLLDASNKSVFSENLLFSEEEENQFESEDEISAIDLDTTVDNNSDPLDNSKLSSIRFLQNNSQKNKTLSKSKSSTTSKIDNSRKSTKSTSRFVETPSSNANRNNLSKVSKRSSMNTTPISSKSETLNNSANVDIENMSEKPKRTSSRQTLNNSEILNSSQSSEVSQKITDNENKRTKAVKPMTPIMKTAQQKTPRSSARLKQHPRIHEIKSMTPKVKTKQDSIEVTHLVDDSFDDQTVEIDHEIKENIEDIQKTSGKSAEALDKQSENEESVFANIVEQPKNTTPKIEIQKSRSTRKTKGNQQSLDESFDLHAAKEKRETELAFENFVDQSKLAAQKSVTPKTERANSRVSRKTIGNQQTFDESFDLQAAKDQRELELAFEKFKEQPNLSTPKSMTPVVQKLKTINTRKTLGNQQTFDESFDLQAAKDQRELELAFEKFEEQPNLSTPKSMTPAVEKLKIKNTRKTLGNQQTFDESFDLQAAKDQRELELAFEKFEEQPKLSTPKSMTPVVQKLKTRNTRKTIGNQQTFDESFNLQAAKDQRELELAFEKFEEQPNLSTPKSMTPAVEKLKIKNTRKTLGNQQTFDESFDLQAAKDQRELELAFEKFEEQPNLSTPKSMTPVVQKLKTINTRKTLGNQQTFDESFDLQAAKDQRELELAFEKFEEQPNLSTPKSMTPAVEKLKIKNTRKTLGNQQTFDESFDLQAAKDQRELELAFEKFEEQPKLSTPKSMTPVVQKLKTRNTRKTIGNQQTFDESFDLQAAKDQRELELAFEKFEEQPNLSTPKSMTPAVEKLKIKNTRKTLGNQQTFDESFDLQAAKDQRELELAFEKFEEQPNLSTPKSMTPAVKRLKTINTRKTMGNQQTFDESFDLQAAKEQREMELAFENFEEQPKLSTPKSMTPVVQKLKTRNTRKTIGNQQTFDESFDLQAAKDQRELELAFEKFEEQPNLSTPKSMTPVVQKLKMKNTRKTMGNQQTFDESFDLQAAKDQRELELAFEKFEEQPNLSTPKSMTPVVEKFKIKNTRKTLGNQQTFDESFDLQAAKDQRELELAFEKFEEQPNLSTPKSMTPAVKRLKTINTRKTMGNQQTFDESFDLQAAKEQREMELAFENFEEQPKLSTPKSMTPVVQKLKTRNTRKTIGNQQTFDESFDLQAAKDQRELELAFEKFEEQPNLSTPKSMTPVVQKLKMKNTRKTMGNQQTFDESFDLQAAKDQRELELAFEKFEEQPNLSTPKSMTPAVKRLKTINTRKTMGNQQTFDESFNLQAAKDQRELELAFEKFEEQPNLSTPKSMTPAVKRLKTINTRKTMGNQQTFDESFDLQAAKEQREMELAFENFEEQPKLSTPKSMTPVVQKLKTRNTRKTIGNQQTFDESFDLQAAKDQRELELAFEKFEEQPNLSTPKSMTPVVQKLKIKNTRKTIGNQQTFDESFDLQAAKEQREMELAFENFEEQPKLSTPKSMTPVIQRLKTINTRKTMGNQQTFDESFDLQAAKEQREMELAFENFEEQPKLSTPKSMTPVVQKLKIKNTRKTMGNQQTFDESFDLKAAKEQREMELAFENFEEQPKLSTPKSRTPVVQKLKIKNTRKTMGNQQTFDESFDLQAAKEQREMELAFENFKEQPKLSTPKSMTPVVQKLKIKSTRKTMGNQITLDESFDMQAAKEQREMELAFEHFENQPKYSTPKSLTPNVEKQRRINSRKTLDNNQVVNNSFDLKTIKENISASKISESLKEIVEDIACDEPIQILDNTNESPSNENEFNTNSLVEGKNLDHNTLNNTSLIKRSIEDVESESENTVYEDGHENKKSNISKRQRVNKSKEVKAELPSKSPRITRAKRKPSTKDVKFEEKLESRDETNIEKIDIEAKQSDEDVESGNIAIPNKKIKDSKKSKEDQKILEDAKKSQVKTSKEKRGVSKRFKPNSVSDKDIDRILTQNSERDLNKDEMIKETPANKSSFETSQTSNNEINNKTAASSKNAGKTVKFQLDDIIIHYTETNTSGNEKILNDKLEIEENKVTSKRTRRGLKSKVEDEIKSLEIISSKSENKMLVSSVKGKRSESKLNIIEVDVTNSDSVHKNSKISEINDDVLVTQKVEQNKESLIEQSIKKRVTRGRKKKINIETESANSTEQIDTELKNDEFIESSEKMGNTVNNANEEDQVEKSTKQTKIMTAEKSSKDQNKSAESETSTVSDLNEATSKPSIEANLLPVPKITRGRRGAIKKISRTISAESKSSNDLISKKSGSENLSTSKIIIDVDDDIIENASIATSDIIKSTGFSDMAESESEPIEIENRNKKISKVIKPKGKRAVITVDSDTENEDIVKKADKLDSSNKTNESANIKVYEKISKSKPIRSRRGVTKKVAEDVNHESTSHVAENHKIEDTVDFLHSKTDESANSKIEEALKSKPIRSRRGVTKKVAEDVNHESTPHVDENDKIEDTFESLHSKTDESASSKIEEALKSKPIRSRRGVNKIVSADIINESVVAENDIIEDKNIIKPTRTRRVPQKKTKPDETTSETVEITTDDGSSTKTETDVKEKQNANKFKESSNESDVKNPSVNDKISNSKIISESYSVKVDDSDEEIMTKTTSRGRTLRRAINSKLTRLQNENTDNESNQLSKKESEQEKYTKTESPLKSTLMSENESNTSELIKEKEVPKRRGRKPKVEKNLILTPKHDSDLERNDENNSLIANSSKNDGKFEIPKQTPQKKTRGRKPTIDKTPEITSKDIPEFKTPNSVVPKSRALPGRRLRSNSIATPINIDDDTDTSIQTCPTDSESRSTGARRRIHSDSINADSVVTVKIPAKRGRKRVESEVKTENEDTEPKPPTPKKRGRKRKESEIITETEDDEMTDKNDSIKKVPARRTNRKANKNEIINISTSSEKEVNTTINDKEDEESQSKNEKIKVNSRTNKRKIEDVEENPVDSDTNTIQKRSTRRRK